MAKIFASSVRLPRWGSLAQVMVALALVVACSSTPQVVNGADDETPGANGGSAGKPSSGGTGNSIDVSGPDDAGSSNVDPGIGGDDDPGAPVCGDGVVAPSEGCDDGNARGGDGCDGTCKVESGGWVCKKPGEACKNTLVCGDGVEGPNEACDDGNTKPGDGCSAKCKVETGYSCDKYGEPCTPTSAPVVCGNGKTEFGETCDDGNTTNKDGCTACQTDDGYTCNGDTCTLNADCGDGTLNSGEQCDDGNQVPFDCCNAKCGLEPDCRCTTPASGVGPQKCMPTIVCGDGAVTGHEACDDGNIVPGDGCSADCKEIQDGYTCPAAGGSCSIAVVTCPNAHIDAGEECDDGNSAGSDGCSANCKVETGYVCPTTGQACKLKEFCGNAQVSYTTGESCDDGNPSPNDGCSATCTIEAGWSCDNSSSPSVCVKEVCGNKKIAAGESCDDGNNTPGDGCDSACKLEVGYTCPVVGAACRSICGDKKKLGLEQCDDGNLNNADGCNSRCQLEPGYVCDAAGSCRKTVCGDKVKEGTEQCDDTATGAVDLPFDGCYKCLVEPDCSTGPCQSTCGDGQRFSDEACDDGNTFNGDGCSSTCTVEAGYSCVDAPESALPSKKNLPVVVRDFVGLGREKTPTKTNANYHPDFNEHLGSGVYQMVKTTLTPAGKPEWRWLPYATQDVTAVATGQTQTTYTPLSAANCTCNEAAPASEWIKTTETWADVDNPGHGADKTITLVRPPCSCSTSDVCTCDNAGHMYRDGGAGGTSNRRNLSTPANFAQWYTNVSGTPAEGANLTLAYTLSLTLNAASSTYSNLADANATAFDPAAGLGWVKSGDETVSGCGTGQTTNVSFSTETHFVFEYQGGERFDFSGDDDTWVFVNRKLAVDIGGLHGQEKGYFILDPDTDGSGTTDTADGTAIAYGRNRFYDGTSYTANQGAKLNLGLVAGKIYEVVMFQAERNQCGSNFGVTLKNFGKPKSICASTCGDKVVAADEACDLGSAANTGGYGGCTPNCTLAAYCGDKAINGSEQCDDGVNANVYGSLASGCAPGCKVAPYCGDSAVDIAYGETCDKGSANSASAYGPNTCSKTCQPGPYCGDGLQNGSESCDEGQNNGGPTSKCDTSCAVKCGNGHLDPGEQCDLGAGSNTGAYGSCKSNCQLAPYCGDGIKQSNEGCDDGKNDGSYGTCLPSCQPGSYCGDSHVDEAAGEVCDLGAQNQPNPYGKGLCATTCKPAPYCGDHAVNVGSGEVCDDGSLNSDTAASVCKLDCSGYNATAKTCGNGKIDAGEQCDHGTANGGGTDTCDARCRFKCGNGFKESGEQCDNGVNDGTYGTCKNDCTLAAYCGDGTKNSSEQCDLGVGNDASAYGPNKCTNSCKTAPYCGDRRVTGKEECDGQIGCNAMCAYDTIK